MKKVALISGITGQDGSFLAEFLIEKGYEVHGILRRSSSFNTGRIEHLYLDEWVRDMQKTRLVNLHWGDMTDSSSLIRIIQAVQPDEIYNLAAQSHVKVSFDVPEYTAEADAVGTLRMLEAVRILGLEKKTKIYQASTSELFGLVQEVPQKETTPFYPRSPYGVAKQYGFWITKNYRESYGMFAVNGILFNHESERRGENFVTRKITLAAARIAQGYQDKLYLGNLDSLRDWGYAKDYVECMWLILQHETPEDFVIATGGGTLMQPQNVEGFHQGGGTIYYLDVPLAALQERLKNDKRRPLLQTPDRRAVIERLLNERRPKYLASADVIVDAGAPTVVVVERICALRGEPIEKAKRKKPGNTSEKERPQKKRFRRRRRKKGTSPGTPQENS